MSDMRPAGTIFVTHCEVGEPLGTREPGGSFATGLCRRCSESGEVERHHEAGRGAQRDGRTALFVGLSIKVSAT